MNLKNSDICVRLMGGLGNQLFQYAFGKNAAINNGANVFFDIENGFIFDPFQRRFALDSFNIEVSAARSVDIPYGTNWKPPFHRISKFLYMMMPESQKRVFYEKNPYEFTQISFNSTAKYKYFVGYWQNLLYFQSLEKPLRDSITLRHESLIFSNLKRKIRSKPSLSVHIRRYNDLNKSGTLISEAVNTHGACSLEYYHAALKKIPKDPGINAYIFTDCLEWCKEHLRIEIPFHYIVDISKLSDAEELILMSECDHHIISNSTFSWWGAWLGKNPQKVVIAPEIWNKSLGLNQPPICPSSWIRI